MFSFFLNLEIDIDSPSKCYRHSDLPICKETRTTDSHSNYTDRQVCTEWSPILDFLNSETQTMDENIDLWLNCVETQTNLTPFNPVVFSDMCVGVDDDLLFVKDTNTDTKV